MLLWLTLCPGTVVYCLDADKKDRLAQINLVDSLPANLPSPNHCNPDKRKGFFSPLFAQFAFAILFESNVPLFIPHPSGRGH